MTTLAQRIHETPMAPYIGVLKGMSKQDMQIVVTFLTEKMKEADEQKTVSESKEEIIRKKYMHLKISPKVKALVDGLSLSKEEMDDERTKHMLGL